MTISITPPERVPGDPRRGTITYDRLKQRNALHASMAKGTPLEGRFGVSAPADETPSADRQGSQGRVA